MALTQMVGVRLPSSQPIIKEVSMKAVIRLDVPENCINQKALVVLPGLVEITDCEPDGFLPEIEGQITIEDIINGQ